MFNSSPSIGARQTRAGAGGERTGGGERRAGLRAAHLKLAFVSKGSRMFSVSLFKRAVSKAQLSYWRSERSGVTAAHCGPSSHV